VSDSQNNSESAIIGDEKNNSPKPERQKASGMLANIAFNIVIPTLVLTKLSSEEYFGPVYSIVVALSFPIIYGLREYTKTRKANFFSILGIISVLLTGGMSLLQLDPQYIAIKEAAIPAIFGLVTIFSVRTNYPLVKTFLYNDQVLQIDKVQRALTAHSNELNFEAKLTNASYMVAGSFFLSSVLNYLLAKVVLVSQPGTVEFTEELGKMTALSFPVIAVPSTLVLMGTLFYLLSHIKKLTHLQLEDIFHEA